MNYNAWLLCAIADLAAIQNEGQLADLFYAFREECTAAGGLPASDERQRLAKHVQAGDIANARDIGRAASQLFGLPESECEQIAREVLTSDPWIKIALDLIDDYRGRRDQQQASGYPVTAEDDANWNPVTGGPAVEAWERQQRERRQRAW